MFRISAGLPPINSTQLKGLLDNSCIQITPTAQDAESSEIAPKTDDAKTKFISPYHSAPSERVTYIFTGNFADLIKTLLNEAKEDGSAQGDEAEAINYYKNWLVLKELTERMDSCANQSKSLILAMASSWLGTSIAPSYFPISKLNWTILASLSFAILAYLSIRFQHLAQAKEAVESEINAFEIKYEFVTEHQVANDYCYASRLGTHIVERKDLVQKNLLFSS